ncbi:hypothetical protein CFP56_012629 [Quercus suber]|uniref:Uncharacterized protein n=1 Tax=Quercus suber TaxID=58331 RepID=A0AAW0KWT4_QUESU
MVCRLQKCFYCGALCEGPNKGCPVYNHKVLSMPPGIYCYTLETTCLNWLIDLLGSTKLIIALRALQLTQVVLQFVKKLPNDAFVFGGFP